MRETNWRVGYSTVEKPEKWFVEQHRETVNIRIGIKSKEALNIGEWDRIQNKETNGWDTVQ